MVVGPVVVVGLVVVVIVVVDGLTVVDVVVSRVFFEVEVEVEVGPEVGPEVVDTVVGSMVTVMAERPGASVVPKVAGGPPSTVLLAPSVSVLVLVGADAGLLARSPDRSRSPSVESSRNASDRSESLSGRFLVW